MYIKEIKDIICGFWIMLYSGILYLILFLTTIKKWSMIIITQTAETHLLHNGN